MRFGRQKHEEPAYQPAARPQRPVVTAEPAIPGRVVINTWQLIRGAWGNVKAAFSFGEQGVIDLHCGTCGSEFMGQWDQQGRPRYSSGVLETKKYHEVLRKYVRVVQRCRCQAGARMPEMMAEASERTWYLNLKRNWLRRREARRISTPEGREAMVNTWDRGQVAAWAALVGTLGSQGHSRAEAMRLAYIEIGNSYDPPPRRPARNSPTSTRKR